MTAINHPPQIIRYWQHQGCLVVCGLQPLTILTIVRCAIVAVCQVFTFVERLPDNWSLVEFCYDLFFFNFQHRFQIQLTVSKTVSCPAQDWTNIDFGHNFLPKGSLDLQLFSGTPSLTIFGATKVVTKNQVWQIWEIGVMDIERKIDFKW